MTINGKTGNGKLREAEKDLAMIQQAALPKALLTYRQVREALLHWISRAEKAEQDNLVLGCEISTKNQIIKEKDKEIDELRRNIAEMQRQHNEFVAQWERAVETLKEQLKDKQEKLIQTQDAEKAAKVALNKALDTLKEVQQTQQQTQQINNKLETVLVALDAGFSSVLNHVEVNYKAISGQGDIIAKLTIEHIFNIFSDMASRLKEVREHANQGQRKAG